MAGEKKTSRSDNPIQAQASELAHLRKLRLQILEHASAALHDDCAPSQRWQIQHSALISIATACTASIEAQVARAIGAERIV